MEKAMRYARIEVSQMGWARRIGIVVAIALALGLAAAFVVLSVGIAILLLPVIAVVLAIGWWRWRKVEAALRAERRHGGAAREGRIIEIEYEVLGDGTQTEPQPGARL
jgi:membrane protein implicated in regulation of membrane protease activity